MNESDMKKDDLGLPEVQLAELQALADMPDDEIDFSDIPQTLDWSDAKRGLFYRPVKQQITLRLDADIVAWFKTQTEGGKGYQTAINRVLREYVARSVSARGSE
jgi:uncharacterized protein (DUF4415 family)